MSSSTYCAHGYQFEELCIKCVSERVRYLERKMWTCLNCGAVVDPEFQARHEEWHDA